MWQVLNKAVGRKYILESNKFNTFDDARAYIRNKIDKYIDFCMNEIQCDSNVEDSGLSVFFSFLGITLVFDIIKTDNEL